MPRLTRLIRKPVFIFPIALTAVLIAEFLVLEGFVGISIPAQRGSAVSSYEIRQKGTEVHYITRNRRFSIVDVWSNHGSSVEATVLRESFVMDRQEGIEGANSTVKVEALDEHSVKWSFEQAGELGVAKGQVYEVIKYGCCDAPNTYTYFSLRNGSRLHTGHTELNNQEFEALAQSLYD